MLKLADIRRLHIELTTRCNARCPMCMRNYRGSDYNSGYPLCELTLQNFKHIVTPDLLMQLIRPDPAVNGRTPVVWDFRGINFNGNLGDFASAKDALEIVQYVNQYHVPVTINTNGSVRNTAWWQALAMPGVTVGFALDGLADTHHLYRQDTDWHRIIKNAKAFIAAGGQAVWRFVPFDHNRHQESTCKQMAADLGFARFENIYDGRDTGPVFSRSGQYSHYLGKANADWSTHSYQELLTSHINWYRKIPDSVNDVDHIEYHCLHKKNREIYIAADGSVYPCCFLGFYPGQMNHPGNTELAQMVRENNALHYPLEHCLQWFDSIESAWSKASVAQGRPWQCVQTCGRARVNV